MPNKWRPAEMIALKSSLTMSQDNKTAEIIIYGVIVDSTAWEAAFGIDSEDVSAGDFDKALKEAKKNGATRLNVRINSPGGIADQAVAMRSMELDAPFDEIVIDVEGLCASAASLLTCVKNARVRMAEGSRYMIHNPMNCACGTADDLESVARGLRALESSVCGIYASRTGKDEAQIKAWMDATTWFTAQEAVDAGFADEVYKGSQAVACVAPDMMNAMRALYGNVPQNVMQAEPGNKTQPPVSNENPSNAAGGSPENTNSEEDTNPMANETKPEEKDVAIMTLEELRAVNPALFNSVMQTGGEEERKRMEDIDALTPPGYEEMAKKAKADGTSTMEYNKMVVKAQRDKAAAFVAQRKTETAPGAAIPGAASEGTDPKDAAAMSDKAAADIAGYAKALNGSREGGMY
jgi:ATP-dependent Clp protease, protease subunit